MTIDLIVMHPGLLKPFAVVTYSDGSKLVTTEREGDRLAVEHNAKVIR